MAAPVEDVVCVSAEFPMLCKKIKCKKGQKISKGSIFCLYTNESTTVQKLKTCHGGVVKEILVKEGEELKQGSPLYKVAICSHPTVMKDMCADCGSDLRLENSSAGQRKEQVSATVAMVHSIPELIVSEQLAQELGKADEDRLLKTRKLVLLVDLDQTLIHTTNDNIPANLKDVHRFQLWHGNQLLWYHTRLRPYTQNFLESISKLYELHICTFGARMYAHTIAKILDPKGIYFSHRILSRDECFNASTKTANLKALFPCGDSMVSIIDDREDVWSFSPNLIHVKPYRFFQGTADINAPPGLTKTEQDRDPIVHRVRRVSQSSTNSVDSNENDKNENTKFPTEEQMKEVEKIKLKRVESMEVEEEGDVVKDDNVKDNNKDCETVPKQKDTTENGKTGVETDKTSSKNEVEMEADKTGVDTGKTSDKNQGEMEVDKTGIETDKTSAKNEGRMEVNKTGVDTVKARDKNKGEMEVDKTEIETDKTSDKNEAETETDKTGIETDKTSGNGETEADKEETNNKDESIKIESMKQKEDPDMGEKNVEIKDQKKAEAVDKEKKKKSGKTVVEDLKTETKKQSEETDKSKVECEEEELVVWEDEDDYLFYLKEILENIHKAFYDMVDQLNVKDQPLKDKDKPNLKNIIPYMKKKVLKGCNLLFSGVIPTNMAPEKSRAYTVAKALGANIHKDLMTKENEKDPQNFTTHLVAARMGTSKVRSALKCRKVSIVSVDWLWSCAERWERVEENLFPLQKSTEDRNCDSPDVSEMTKKRKHQANEMAESDSKRIKTTDNKGKQKKAGKGEEGEGDTFSHSYNPLFAFSDDDLAYMDKEVDDEMDSEGASSSEEDEDREKRLRDEVLKEVEDNDNTSEDSLCGNMPRGWGIKKMSPKSSSSEDEPKKPSPRRDELGPEYESETDQDKFEKIMDAFGQDTENSDDEDYQDSIGSVDDELAAAVEKEFLS